METIPVIFGKSWNIFGVLIRLFTWSRWSHVGAITPDGKFVIEASGTLGVVETPIEEFKRRYTQYEITQIPVRDRGFAYRFLRGEIGKPYDRLAILGIFFRRDWQQTDAWFCSELIARASQMFRRSHISRITQEDVYCITIED